MATTDDALCPSCGLSVRPPAEASRRCTCARPAPDVAPAEVRADGDRFFTPSPWRVIERPRTIPAAQEADEFVVHRAPTVTVEPPPPAPAPTAPPPPAPAPAASPDPIAPPIHPASAVVPHSAGRPFVIRHGSSAPAAGAPASIRRPQPEPIGLPRTPGLSSPALEVPVASPPAPAPALATATPAHPAWGVRIRADVNHDGGESAPSRPEPEPSMPSAIAVPAGTLPRAPRPGRAHGRPAEIRRQLALRLGITGASVGALLLMGYAGWTSGAVRGIFLSGPPLSQPSRIGALTLIDNEQTQAVVASMQRALGSDGAQAVAGVYGNGSPQLIFAASRSPGALGTAQLIASVTAPGMRFTTAGAVTATLAGQSFTCGVLDGAPFGPSALCAWNEEAIDAIIVTTGNTDLQAALSLAAQARAAAER